MCPDCSSRGLDRESLPGTPKGFAAYAGATELVGDVGEGAPGEFEAATVAEDDGEGVGWGRGEVDFDEDGGRGTAAIGVEGREGEVVGGAEGGAGLAG